MTEARVLLAKGDYATAEQRVITILDDSMLGTEALLLASQCATGLGDNNRALEYLDRIPDDNTPIAVQARYSSGEIWLFGRKHLSEAISQYERAVAMNAQYLPGHERLAYAFGLSSRSWEAIPHRLEILKLADDVAPQVYALALGERVLENPELIGELLDASPEDAAALMGQGRVALEVRNFPEAERLLRAAIRQQPDLIQAYVWLGKTLEARGDAAAMERWQLNLPQKSSAHPSIWFVQGLWAKRQEKPEIAIRCFWEAVLRDPNHAQSNYLLGQLLVAANRKADAEAFLTRARLLEQYIKVAEVAYHTRSMAELEQTVNLAESCGLIHETVGWCNVILAEQSGHLAARRVLETRQPQLETLGAERAVPTANPALQIDLSHFPLPVQGGSSSAESTTATANLSVRQAKFDEVASRVGIDFQYFNSGEPLTKGIVGMYEVVGGGSAVLDYDRDGWPDLHFSQGCRWPQQPGQREFLDRVFRNTGLNAFDDVTEFTGIVEDRFSQGATVGDVNSDGFPDIYINNIGPNRLYLNNGDGTFDDITVASGTAGDDYSVSSVVADLNGDGLPDIYVVNYLAGDDLFTKVCGDGKGLRASCLPQLFPAAQDRLYINQGNGTFRDVTREAGVMLTGGKGLGIVAANFDDSGRISLFIANDVSPNFFLVNQTTTNGEMPEFQDQGLSRGLALNFDGQHESSMGIAAGDADGDGRIDLFVTNFDNETNTYYHQLPGTLFEDITRESGLATKTKPWLGWGAQFVDGDLDGDLDLVVTNGHINDLSLQGRPYQMPPQYYQNDGTGHFEQQSAMTVGDYFQGNFLGRGMTRLDWNRDGREDLVISHLDTPVALLSNSPHTETDSPQGKSVRLRLVAVNGARDAIGTTISAVVKGKLRVCQLIAGDGNQASNERVIILGLDAADAIDSLKVQWVTGSEQQFGQLRAGTEYLLIEGRDEPLVLKHDS